MERRTPVYIVCSPRPRTGKTLLSRVLAEFFLADRRAAAAFDVNPDEFSLVDYLPAHTAVASIDDVGAQMALFDQLIAPDQVPKIVDLGHAMFDRFFALVHDLDFMREAQRRRVAPVVLFMADPDRRSRQGYDMLRDRFRDLALIPVLNEAVPVVSRYRDAFPPTPRGGPALPVPLLAAVLRTVIEKPGFSFAAYSSNTADTTTELYGWTRRMFLAFREFELRMLLDDLRPALRISA